MVTSSFYVLEPQMDIRQFAPDKLHTAGRGTEKKNGSAVQPHGLGSMPTPGPFSHHPTRPSVCNTSQQTRRLLRLTGSTNTHKNRHV